MSFIRYTVAAVMITIVAVPLHAQTGTTSSESATPLAQRLPYWMSQSLRGISLTPTQTDSIGAIATRFTTAMAEIETGSIGDEPGDQSAQYDSLFTGYAAKMRQQLTEKQRPQFDKQFGELKKTIDEKRKRQSMPLPPLKPGEGRG